MIAVGNYILWFISCVCGTYAYRDRVYRFVVTEILPVGPSTTVIHVEVRSDERITDIDPYVFSVSYTDGSEIGTVTGRNGDSIGTIPAHRPAVETFRMELIQKLRSGEIR